MRTLGKALSITAGNLIRNHLSANARFVPAFASDVENAKVQFWTRAVDAARSMYRSRAQSAAKANSSMEVPTVTLDGVPKLYGITPDLVKIDVEGVEHKVLEGTTRVRFFVEMHSNPDVPMRETAAAVLNWCRQVTYQAWYLQDGEHLDDPAKIEHRGRCHLLLQPSDWPYPEWLRTIRQGDDVRVVAPVLEASHA